MSSTIRTATVNRKTGETDISLTLNLCEGELNIQSGIGFFNHMLTLLCVHGGLSLNLKAAGDLDVDCHHTVEDIGIALGAAFREALGDCKGIRRYGDIILPMDEALVLIALDISGRAYLNAQLELNAKKVGNFDTELIEEFLLAFCRSLGLTLHVKQLSGTNAHHISEAVFKGLGRALKQAVAIEGDAIPSSKGVLF